MEYERVTMTTRSIYDGVFTGISSHSSPSGRPEDYADIFRGSDSSIPVLDVPELHERRIAVDVKCSSVDYSKIFGGFSDSGGVDYEQLFDIRKLVGTKESHLSAAANPVSPVDAASYKSVNAAKEFKVSYNKTDRGSEIGTNGTTHIAQLHAVPAYTHIFDEMNKSEEEKKHVSTSKSSCLNGVSAEGRNHSKSISDIPSFVAPPFLASKQTSKSGVIYPNKTSKGRTNSVDMLFDASEPVLRTPVSGMPPSSSQPYSFSNNTFERVRSKSGVSKFNLFDSDVMPDSPPYFDTELDNNSVAAASGAAVRKAIEEAQEKLKIAKEIMERRKKNLQTHAKLKKKSSAKVEVKHVEMDTPMQNFSRKAGTVTSNFQGPVELPATRNAPEEANQRHFESPNLDLGEEKPEQSKEVNSGKNENEIKLPVSGYAQVQEPIANKTMEMMDENYKKLEETPKQGVVARLLDAVKWAYELTDHAKKPEPAVEVLDHEILPPKSESAVEIPDHEKFHKSRIVEMKEKTKEGIAQNEAEEGIAQNEAEPEEEIAQNEAETEMGLGQPEEEIVEELTESHGPEACGGEMENDQIPEVAQIEEETKVDHKAFYEPESCIEKIKELPKPTEDEQMPDISKPGMDEIWNRLIDVQKETQNLEDHDEANLDQVSSQNQTENSHKEASQRMKVETEEQTKACKLDENYMEQKIFHYIEETENRHEESSWAIEVEREESPQRIEENHVEDKDVHNHITDSNEKRVRKVWGQNIVTEIFTKFDDTVESEEESLEDDVEFGENEQLTETGSVHPETYQVKEVEQTSDWVKTNLFPRDIYQAEEEKTAVTQETLNGEDEFENQSKSSETYENEENIGCRTPACEANGEARELTEARFECNENLTRSKTVDVASILDETDSRETASFTRHWVKIDEVEKQARDAINASIRNSIGNMQHNHDVEDVDVDVFCNEGNHIECFAREVEESHDDIEKNEVTIKQEKPKQFESATYEDKVESAETSNQHDTVKENEARDLKDAENEHIKKVDEEIVRKREKEKERVVVERAIREARERAFAEARERAAAKKANAEERRRALANDHKSASLEAKRKAERAAVERATAEARERALEKALSDKATAQPRKQQDVRKNDAQYKNSGPRHPNPSDHKDGTNGEPAEVSKARLERNQRTADRAAKALAEKNMRDLLVQKEQAERDRLADSLDSEIKRWSSGKEGNLRALLSTLQYVLGANSGWQPTPLTDLIATAAVRKVYRRATLFVHPDKLQQRGATIQQKYICEKVFDLLKDAWNKFSIEER